MKSPSKHIIFIAAITLFALIMSPYAAAESAKPAAATAGRERLLMDFGWCFAFGHPYDSGKDFNHATGFFSYLAKAGNGDGAAAAKFDDRAWRRLDLPHDWAVELPFSERGSGSHGYKAIGKYFPDASVGWYRKTFSVPASDLGRHITVEFDGVFRDSQVWLNGFYLGREPSGYSSFGYDLTDYLNYGGNNTIAVRVDASLEEGWFYEGAGVYRHVWLTKTGPLHVAKWGTFVSTDVKDNSADVTARVTVDNDSAKDANFQIEQTILDADGKSIAGGKLNDLSLKAGATGEYSSVLAVPNPKLWSIETPYMHTLVTTIRQGDAVVDRYETPFGIRTLRWDANEGFFLNGKRVQLKGTCDHQDHAGVGAAIPDELNVFRIEQLKKMGSNAIRTSHNAPTPELLDACDRLGMLVMDENREIGVNPQQLDGLKRLILRDRNHPSVIIWSLGNEEWSIEGNEKGTRVTQTMQTFAQRLDPTRRITVGISGGWGAGSSVSIDVMGFNYFTHGDGRDTGNDRYHAKFPDKPSVASEDASAFSTRGIYVEDRDHQHLTAYDLNKAEWSVLAEESWKHYAERPYVAGQFQWTGFDYRGEPTPFSWPAVSSQFGILDTCGFPKDSFYYYQAWWSDRPVLHMFPHWNWPGKEGKEIDVWVHGNCEEVELFLNGQSLGRKKMTKNSHLEWKVKYVPGTLQARGYMNGKVKAIYTNATTGDPAAIALIPHYSTIKADGEDVAVITVQINDAQERLMPTGGNEIAFALKGPGKIIGVGNGDPSSHEPDRYVDTVSSLPVTAWRMQAVDGAENRPEVAADFDDSGWQTVFAGQEGGRGGAGGEAARAGKTIMYRGVFELPESKSQTVMSLILRSLGQEQSVYINGKPIARNVGRNNAGHEFTLDQAMRHPGKNVVAVVVTPIEGGRPTGEPRGGDASTPGLIRITSLAGDWKRSAFNGLSQVIVQSTQTPGEITLTATSKGLTQAELKLQSLPAAPRPSVPAK